MSMKKLNKQLLASLKNNLTHSPAGSLLMTKPTPVAMAVLSHLYKQREQAARQKMQATHARRDSIVALLSQSTIEFEEESISITPESLTWMGLQVDIAKPDEEPMELHIRLEHDGEDDGVPLIKLHVLSGLDGDLMEIAYHIRGEVRFGELYGTYFGQDNEVIWLLHLTELVHCFQRQSKDIPSKEVLLGMLSASL